MSMVPPKEMAGLEQAMGAALEILAEQGFEAPLIVVAVGLDGALVALRTDTDKTEVLAEHDEGGVFVGPINLMAVDARGEAARLVIDGARGEPRLVHDGQ